MAPSDTLVHQGVHADLTDRSLLPFDHVKDLGRGSSAVVDVVQHKITGTVFAHKAFYPRNSRDVEELKQAFQNEVDIIKRFPFHPHLIQVHWSYTCDKIFGMLLLPVASDGDLKGYLQMIRTMEKPLTPKQYSVLGRSFGCLASGLAFVHSYKIRHKDIKPANILIHKGLMIITDFGIALDTSGEDTTSTSGPPGAFTDRYRAPEVARYEPRNRKSDVFSLGCVYLEIMALLAPRCDMGVLDARPYWTRVDGVQDTLIRVSNSDSKLHPMCLIFSSMLKSRSTDRVDARAVSRRLQTMGKSQSKPSYELICKDCRTSVSNTSDNGSNSAEATGSELGASVQEEFGALQDPSIFSRWARIYGPFTIQAAMEYEASRPLSWSTRNEGYIYIIQHPHYPNFIRIGRTNNVCGRIQQLRRMYKCNIVEYDQGERRLVQRVARIERLVHTHLRDVRYEENREQLKAIWFRATPEHATRLVKQYSDWVTNAEYAPTGPASGDTWVLKSLGRIKALLQIS